MQRKTSTIVEQYDIMGLRCYICRRKGVSKSMKCGITIQERLKDLRTERHLKLGELEKLTGISSSALSSYENNDYKEINHGNLLTLAKFYGVSTDYLLCLTENRNHPNTTLTELHLSDEMIDLLKSRRINNRLLCEIITHEDFITLITDAEIYVDGIATARFQDLNAMLEVVRAEVLRQYQPSEEDTPLKALKASQIQEEDYFCHVTHKTWDSILHDIRETHKNDIESMPDSNNSLKLIKDMQKALRVPGTFLDVFCHIICDSLKIKYNKLSEKERSDLKRVLQKSEFYKSSPLSNRKMR